jgi:hypothetical protein
MGMFHELDPNQKMLFKVVKVFLKLSLTVAAEVITS